MKVVVCIPWIDVGCTWRERAREFTARHWARLGVPVVYGVDDSSPPNRARARNNAALTVDADVLFFADADTWVPLEQFLHAVGVASDTGRFVWAYTDHVKLSRATTLKLHDGANVPLLGQRVAGMSSGAIAVSRNLHDRVGGHDERFEGWGGEDRAFEFACTTLSADGMRIPGDSYHLWHPRAREFNAQSAERKAGIALARRYKLAAGITQRTGIVPATKGAQRDPVAMEALLQEQGGPLHRRVASAHG